MFHHATRVCWRRRGRKASTGASPHLVPQRVPELVHGKQHHLVYFRWRELELFQRTLVSQQVQILDTQQAWTIACTRASVRGTLPGLQGALTPKGNFDAVGPCATALVGK